MTVRHLKIFVTVVDCKSMSGAAAKLYISQPTVSQAIADLEKYYGVRLFERLSQKLYITEQGKQLLSYARHITDSFESMEEAMRKVEGIPHLSIGCSVSVGTFLLNELLDRFEKEQKECKVNVTVDNTSAIEKLILDSEVDLGIVEGIVKSPDLVTAPVCRDELVLVCGKNYHLARKTNIDFSDLEGENFISREKGSIERNQLEKVLGEHKITLNRCWNCTNTEAIKNAVIHGRGIAILSNMLTHKECQSGDMVILNLEGMHFERTIHLVYHKNKYLSQSMQTMIGVCKDYYKTLFSTSLSDNTSTYKSCQKQS